MKTSILDLNDYDKEEIYQNMNILRNKSNQELIDSYNREVKIGLVGVRAQLRKLTALDVIFIERFGSSPISNEIQSDYTIISINQRIKLINDKWFFEINEN